MERDLLQGKPPARNFHPHSGAQKMRTPLAPLFVLLAGRSLGSSQTPMPSTLATHICFFATFNGFGSSLEQYAGGQAGSHLCVQ